MSKGSQNNGGQQGGKEGVKQDIYDN